MAFGRGRAFALVFVAVLGVMSLASGNAVAQPAVQPALPFPIPPSPPELDAPFYAPPLAAYADLAPGDIIAARQVDLANLSIIPVNVDAWQLSYRSTNTRGEPVAAVTTVIKPRGGPAKDGVRKLVSFQIAEDSLAQYCAPSYAMQMGSIPTVATGAQVASLEFLEIQTALAQGWAVSVPDYQGPNSAYAAGPLHARLTLDGIRAAERFAPMGLSGTQTPVGLWGYSGGAIATGHTAEAWSSYAPEINLVGVAEGGIPADLGHVLNLAQNGAASGLILAAVLGLGREYPEFQQFLEQHTNPLGKALMAVKNPLCVAYTALLLPFVNNKGLLDVPGDPLDHPVVKSIIDRTRMGKTTPKVPMFMYQSNPDWIIPVGPVNTLVDTYCKDPAARIQYTRDHFSEHLSLGAIGAPAALLFLKDRFDGVPFQQGCTTADAGSMALDAKTYPLFASAVGDVLAGLFGRPLGQ